MRRCYYAVPVVLFQNAKIVMLRLPCLWLDPKGATGILVGRKGPARGFGAEWPGLEGARAGIPRDLEGALVRTRVIAGPERLAEYAKQGDVVTDDNQLLSYGPQRYRFFDPSVKKEALNFFAP